jgi:hypothetical protein
MPQPPDAPDANDPFSQIFDPKFVESAAVREASARERAKWAKSTRRQVKMQRARRSAGSTFGSYTGGIVLIGTLSVVIFLVRDYYS